MSDNNALKEFTIRGRYWNRTKCFPDLNDYIAALGRSPHAGGEMKRKYMSIASRSIRNGLKGWKTSKPVVIHYVCGEPLDGHYRDKSNVIAFAVKVIEDALQKCNVIVNDSPRYMRDYTHAVKYEDAKNLPYIRVVIKEVGDD